LPAALGFDFARSKRPKLLPVFQILAVAVTLVQAALIVDPHNRPFGFIWPLPFMMVLLVLCAVALRREELSQRRDQR
jgi:hypothetical protein